MPYQIFARKYRPQTFSEIIGQDHITRTLENAIKLNRIAQAYLLVGPRGTGKTSTARIIAKALNCPNGPRIDFDPRDPVCLEIAEGRSLDVIEIDGASNRNIDNIREIRESTRYAPNAARFKIYYIDEVHMLTHEAFNALLKTLEEPPPHVKFIFATTEAHKVPPTILSRCQRFDFRRIPESLIAQHLAWICKNENIQFAPRALRLIARHADGALRDAEVALDQIISFYGSPITEEGVTEIFGLTGFAPVASLLEAIAQADTAAILTQTRALAQAGRDLSRLSQDLLRLLRHIIAYQSSPDSLREELAEDEKQKIQALSKRIPQPTALQWMQELSQLESTLRYSIAKDILLEVALLRLCQIQHKFHLESLLKQLIHIESTGQQPDPFFHTPQAETASALPPDQAWAKVATQFAQDRSLERATIQSIQFKGYANGTLTLSLPHSLKHKLPFLNSPTNTQYLTTRLSQLLQSTVQIRFEIDPAPIKASEAPQQSSQPNPVSSPLPPQKISQEQFLNDPAIQKAVEIFQGKIITP